MSRHATEHKKNLLDTMPIDDKGDALLNKGYVTMGTGPKAGAGPKETAYKKMPKEPVLEKGTRVSMTSRSKTVHEDNPIEMTGSPLGKRFMGINPAHKGYCTPMTKATCTPRRKALAKRLKPGGDLYKGKKSWQKLLKET